MNIVELLTLRGLDTSADIKLVRHQDTRRAGITTAELYRKGYLETYQSYQAAPIFNCDYIVTLLGMTGSLACFVGVYRVLSKQNASDVPVPKDFPILNFSKKTDVYYSLEAMQGFDDLKDRVVIDWGSAPLAWHQWLSKTMDDSWKEVVQVLPSGYVTDFPGYLEFDLSLTT